jgi:periplasmic divalent cation tolerance protein
MSNELLVLVTAPSEDEARRIANTLVEERLAACVNIVASIESVYRWEGRVTTDREALLIVKTTAARYEQVERRVKELHTYSTPEVIAIKIERGSTEYLSWLQSAVTRQDKNADG